MNRRQFIKRSLAVAVAAASGPAVSLLPSPRKAQAAVITKWISKVQLHELYGIRDEYDHYLDAKSYFGAKRVSFDDDSQRIKVEYIPYNDIFVDPEITEI